MIINHKILIRRAFDRITLNDSLKPDGLYFTCVYQVLMMYNKEPGILFTPELFVKVKEYSEEDYDNLLDNYSKDPVNNYNLFVEILLFISMGFYRNKFGDDSLNYYNLIKKRFEIPTEIQYINDSIYHTLQSIDRRFRVYCNIFKKIRSERISMTTTNYIYYHIIYYHIFRTFRRKTVVFKNVSIIPVFEKVKYRNFKKIRTMSRSFDKFLLNISKYIIN